MNEITAKFERKRIPSDNSFTTILLKFVAISGSFASLPVNLIECQVINNHKLVHQMINCIYLSRGRIRINAAFGKIIRIKIIWPTMGAAFDEC